ncbi:cysteine desulfuration protein SufE [Phyllobacterium salinisoli]|uniref:Cysteine desulfuration protein SufE n=1 Tax=Phyllobacterium salinisoli TaxID=1899321 RepID=A0A368K1M8_9HYPH|nr:SufE family protein [Phyllobacterium salinisoli]RCS23298.1 cysteine desulfuration protein SufE [Phyllobacterium salinisoli]
MTQTFDDIITDFDVLDDWEDRYRYVIDLGRDLKPYPEDARDAAHKVQGCVSQVWLKTEIGEGEDPEMIFLGDSDAHIVRGLVAIVLTLYSGRRASEILAIDPDNILKTLGLDEHLTPQRSNGLRAMIRRIRSEAQAVLIADSAIARH